ncbi:E3 ubiquitin-protein ligase RFWD3 isoform X2 [Mucor ambiguus]|uniref:RING-type E3 ubiquitin transferase n=1 Tax=Mucor ambiguus TaxID=91626 RepID=A0A0C9MZG4_9FUNG|nr:E3 ubiquitin-protein ligase RFWD3 isoform X2 [Mucor ambiguus]
MEAASGGNHPIQTQSTQDAEESNSCVICSEAWKRSGSHCAVSLACGHMFGKRCIERWIQDRLRRYGAKGVNCPMCMKPARQTELRHVIPSRIAARDTGISDKLKAELEKKKGQIKAEERFLDHSRLALAVLNNQIKSRERNLKHKQVSDNTTTTTPPPSDIKPDTPIPTAAGVEMPAVPSQEKEKEEDTRQLQSYRINFSHRLSENRNVSRVMAIDAANQSPYISFKSTESESGVIHLNPQHPASTNYIPIHTGLIKDIKHNSNGLLMTTGLDRSVKFTSTTSNAVAGTISLPLPGWSCCFDPNDDYKVACGLSDSTIRVYDRRHTMTYLQELCSPLVSKTPLHSLFFKPVNNESKIYCSNLNQTFIWSTPSSCAILNLDSYAGYNPYSLSDHGDQQVLLSSRNKTTTKHQLLDTSSKSSNVPTIVSTIDSAAPQKGFARTYAYLPQDTLQSPIICYGDEVSGTLNLTRKNQVFQHFNIHSCPLDIILFDTERLAFLTDNRFFLLKPLYTTD